MTSISMSIMVSFRKRSLHVATCYCAISRCRFRRSKVCSFLFLNRGLEVKEVKLWISLILLKHLMTIKTKYLATYPIPKLLVSDLDCLMRHLCVGFFLYQGHHTAPGTAPRFGLIRSLKGIRDAGQSTSSVELRAKFQKLIFTLPPVFFRDVAFVEKNITWILPFS